MPVGKLTKGKSFRGVLRYIWQKLDHRGEPRPTVEFVAGSVRDRDPDAAARHFGLVRRMRQQRRDAVRHISIRCAPEDFDRFDAEVQAEIADRVVGRLGYDTWQAVSHGDHLHIVASLIRSDGSVADDSWNYRVIESELREIRIEYGLREVRQSPALERTPNQTRQPKNAEKHYQARTKRMTEKQRLQHIIRRAAEQTQGQDAQTFLDTLESAGVDVQANWTKDGRLTGYSLALPGGERGPMSASKIDRSMTVKGLEEAYGINMTPKTEEVPDEYRTAAQQPGESGQRSEGSARPDRDDDRSEPGTGDPGEPDRRTTYELEQSDRRGRADDRQRRPEGRRSFRDRLRAAARLLTIRHRAQTAEIHDEPEPPGPGGP